MTNLPFIRSIKFYSYIKSKQLSRSTSVYYTFNQKSSYIVYSVISLEVGEDVGLDDGAIVGPNDGTTVRRKDETR
jgi:hypothetical protein